MPSPFPGMDPYLESPAFWRGVHTNLVVFIGRALNIHLPPGFAAKVEERVYLQWEDNPSENRFVQPDVMIRREPVPVYLPVERGEERGGTAVLERPVDNVTELETPYEVVLLSPRERERFIEVVTTGDESRVVAVIEVLSPANKTPGSGRREYLSKQKALLGSETHLLEIDLLRGGQHTVAVPEQAVRERSKTWDYLFCLHRGGEDEHYQYWAKTVRDRLPRTLFVPLTDGVPDAILDLQAVFEEVCDAGRYPRQADYTAAPFPPLAPEDEAWANALLQAAGLRPPLPSSA